MTEDQEHSIQLAKSGAEKTVSSPEGSPDHTGQQVGDNAPHPHAPSRFQTLAELAGARSSRAEPTAACSGDESARVPDRYDDLHHPLHPISKNQCSLYLSGLAICFKEPGCTPLLHQRPR